MDKLAELNDFKPESIDIDLYNDFKNELKRLKGDVDYYTAWKMAKWANGLIDYYHTEKIRAKGELEDAKVELETLKANKSIELGDNVSDGERKAEADKEVKEMKLYLNKVERYVNYLSGLVEKLEKDHYLMKQRHAEGEKEYGRSD